MSVWKTAWISFQKKRSAMIGLIFLTVLAMMAMIGPTLCGYTYYDIQLGMKNQPPSLQHWFGTDDLGRDLFTRIWYGARISLMVGIAAGMVDCFIGMVWGGAAAYAGGKVDECMMRTADILYALPYLLLVILLMVVMGPGLITIIVAMTLTGWITMARIVRGQILQLKQQEFILAATALGASSTRILFLHLLPNALGPIIITLTLTIPAAIFVEAFLSFLGLGVQAPIASWGTMANEGLPALKYYPWRIFFPSLFISLTMLAFNFVGEGLREAFGERG